MQIDKKLLKICLIFLGVVFILPFGVNTVSASSSNIYVNGSHGNDSWNGNSWATAKLTIKNATGTATKGNTVNIANGIYTGSGNTNITINNNITIKGQNQIHTVINGTGKNWIFYIPNDVSVSIEDLTLTNGTTGGLGGAINANHNSVLNVKSCTFTGNNAMRGGAIYNEGTLTVNGSSFNGNTAVSSGAIENYGTLNVAGSDFTGNTATSDGGGITSTLNCIITDSSFTGNYAHGPGGAIYNTGTLVVKRGNFTGNTANYGFAICNDHSCNLTGITFSGNSAFVDGGGGALYNEDDSTCSVAGCTFISNTASKYSSGGAIENFGSCNVTGSTFTGNIGLNGAGAIFNGDNGNGNITGCTFTGNTAVYGGALLNTGNCNVTSCTFTGNTATYGGAFSNSGNCNVTSSTFTGNTATHYAAIYNEGVLNLNFNRIFGNILDQDGVINNSVSGILDASLNWWGSNTGPSDIIGASNSTTWLVLSITANPVIMGYNGKSTISGNLLTDNNGNSVAGYLPDGTSIFFTTTLGSIASSSNTVHGNAQTFLYSGLINGLAAVTAKLDNQTMTTYVTIKDNIPPAVTSNPVGGFYNISKIVTLKISEAGTIYYTLNGSTPTSMSTEYTGPITVSKNTVLKYFAVDLAGNTSPVYTQNYTIDKIPPRVTKTTPLNKKTKVSKTSTITIKFSEIIKASSYFSKITVKNLKTGKTITLSKSINKNTLNIKTKTRTAYTWYQVTIPKAAIKDQASNNLRANYTFKFKTGA